MNRRLSFSARPLQSGGEVWLSPIAGTVAHRLLLRVPLRAPASRGPVGDDVMRPGQSSAAKADGPLWHGILWGILGGVGGFFGGGYAGDGIDRAIDPHNGDSPGFAGFLIGCLVGAPVGAFILARIGP